MATKITPKDFVEALKDWSILDVVEAVKAIEDEFGIKAAAPVAVAAAGPAAAGDGAAAEEEQTEFTVTLTQVGESKINVIKAVRELTQLGLKEAKDLVDAAPKPVLENVSKADAEKAVARLKEAGATADRAFESGSSPGPGEEAELVQAPGHPDRRLAQRRNIAWRQAKLAPRGGHCLPQRAPSVQLLQHLSGGAVEAGAE